MNKAEYTHNAAVMFCDSCSAGFDISEIPAITNPQLATGPQKCVVLGPVGEFRNARRLDIMPTPAIFQRRQLPNLSRVFEEFSSQNKQEILLCTLH